MPIVNEELSERELEILSLLATGVSNKEIAGQLSISTNTVKVHVRNIFAKIGASSRTEAVLYAMKAGLIPPAAGGVEAALTEDVLEAPGECLAPEDNREEASGYIASSDIVFQPLDVSDLNTTRPTSRRFLIWIIGLAVLILLAIVVGVFGAWRTSRARQVEVSPISSQNEARWRVLAPMSVARQGLAAVAYEGMIYAMAGKTVSGPTGAVERYNPTDNTWKRLADKPTSVDDVSAAVAGGEIYVPGGRLVSGQVTDVLEIYDPRQDKWRQGSPMPEARSAYALVAYEGRLFLIGGWDGSRFVDTVYSYDPKLDTWQQKMSLPSPRGYAGAALVGRKIYVLGGYNGRHALDENLIYSPDQDGDAASPWETGQPMPLGRYGMGVASIAEIVELVGGIQEDENQPILSLSYMSYNNTW